MVWSGRKLPFLVFHQPSQVPSLFNRTTAAARHHSIAVRWHRAVHLGCISDTKASCSTCYRKPVRAVPGPRNLREHRKSMATNNGCQIWTCEPLVTTCRTSLILWAPQSGLMLWYVEHLQVSLRSPLSCWELQGLHLLPELRLNLQIDRCTTSRDCAQGACGRVGFGKV